MMLKKDIHLVFMQVSFVTNVHGMDIKTIVVYLLKGKVGLKIYMNLNMVVMMRFMGRIINKEELFTRRKKDRISNRFLIKD